FKGLTQFEAVNAEVSFGRDSLIAEVVARLAEAPLLAIIGPSGGGKSSLLRAGFLPALDRESVVVRPGERSPAELVDLLERVPPGEQLVLAVVQFEELFDPSVAEHDRRAFLASLVVAGSVHE